MQHILMMKVAHQQQHETHKKLYILERKLYNKPLPFAKKNYIINQQSYIKDI